MLSADNIFEMGLAKLREKNLPVALSYLIETLKRDPAHVEAWISLGALERAQGRPFSAMLYFEKALTYNPDRSDAWNNIGQCAAENGMWEMSEDALKKSIDILPSDSLGSLDPWMNLASVYGNLMRLKEAEKCYREALKIYPANYEAYIQLSITLLGLRQWKEGFKCYEYRHKNTQFPHRAFRKYPVWKGEDISGKTIILFPEQGFGDEIIFLRYVSSVKSLGAKVILEARPPMMRVAATTEPYALIGRDDPFPDGVDLCCPTMDIPMVLGIEPHKESHLPYLKAPSSDKVQEWRQRLPKSGMNVGICWITGQRPLQPETEPTARAKSVPLSWLQPLMIPGINLVSLQKQHVDNDIVKAMGVIDFMPEIDDFADTANLMGALDLVISVDTANAHLAGAIGKPVWNMVRFSGFWPWGTFEEPIEWYNTMKVYRQPQINNWDSPIKDMASDLERMVRLAA